MINDHNVSQICIVIIRKWRTMINETKFKRNYWQFEILNFDNWDLPFDFAQGGELVEPFEIWVLVLGDCVIYLDNVL